MCFDGAMSFFPWAMVFVGLAVLALVAVALLGLRLWRQLKALGRESASAAQSWSRLDVPLDRAR
jgi:hypothetical protein